ncbi:conserved hypothetical protein [Candidatus Desulfarcum epimagneticum]|uniref:Uncharacterized protein n=1 Tax=uncultured Desulfobacteraceae bacterium TaxID=218296 RepID=A0A484HCV1_9BACT|nr:conserved hypothetical protein [uncultured Desulfobacteraceae bacterium]
MRLENKKILKGFGAIMYVVNYRGPFGFIKPWTAVRDIETFSQQFLTPSIVAGIERKLFPDLLHEPYDLYKIKSHRLSYKQISHQQEQTQPRGWNKKNNRFCRPYAILVRGVLIEPDLYLGFDNEKDAIHAAKQHICLCRNEDILFPDGSIINITEEDFDSQEGPFNGFELVFEQNDQSFLVGYNRFDEHKPMYGWLKIIGNPVKHIC